MHGWHREPTDGSKGGWGSDFLCLSLSRSPSFHLSKFLWIYLSISLSNLSVYLSVCLSKVWCLPRKRDARSYEVVHLSPKVTLGNLMISCSKCNLPQESSRNQRPDLWTCLPLVLRLPRKIHLCRSSSNVPRLPSFLQLVQNPQVWLAFKKVQNPLRLPRQNGS